MGEVTHHAEAADFSSARAAARISGAAPAADSRAGHPRAGDSRVLVQIMQSNTGNGWTDDDGISGAGQDKHARRKKAAFNAAKATP
jgi:hypothetical protein